VADTKLGLTIYLLKPDQVAAFEADVKPGRDVRPLAEPLDGEFIPLPSAIGEPAWVGVVRGALQDSAGLSLTSQSPAGLLITRRGPNTFVLSFPTRHPENCKWSFDAKPCCELPAIVVSTRILPQPCQPSHSSDTCDPS
jgi:hypothetical protein